MGWVSVAIVFINTALILMQPYIHNYIASYKAFNFTIANM